MRLRHLLSASSKMLNYPACERNKEAILQVIRNYIPLDRSIFLLEIASGSGQHTTHFAPHFPNVTFQPTDIEQQCLNSIDAYRTHLGLKNVLPAAFVDVTKPLDQWNLTNVKPGAADVVYNANMIHISSNAAVDGIFVAAGKLLKPNGLLITYGPYAINGTISPDSNINFDHSLRRQNKEWGLRDTAFLNELAGRNGMQLKHVHDMPANNKTLIFVRQ